MYICLHLHFLSTFTAHLCTSSNNKTLFSWLTVTIDVACMVSLRSTLVLRLSVIFTIGENFRIFPKISGNFLLELNFRKILQPYTYTHITSNFMFQIINYYRAKLCVARYCHGKLSVCLSVRPSVTLRYRDHIGWNSAKIISRLISLTISLSADPNMTDLLQREQPQILAGIWVG